MRKNYLLMSLLALGLMFGVSSCKDDDDKEPSPEQKEQQVIDQLNQANKYWAVVAQLAGSDAYTEGWQDKTFAPIIGQADHGNEAVRIIMTGDLQTAALRFCNLVGIEANGFDADKDYTWSDENIGTLIWHKGGATDLATVDVTIKQMPGLSKLVYRAPEQVGENGDFKGTSYYRFGDVVSKVEDGQTDYWVCVRPAFGPEGKEDSHWVCVNPLHGNYIKEFKKKGRTHNLPVNLCTNKEHMQNFAELIYALLKPLDYGDNLEADYKNLDYFHDFHYPKNYDYNNNAFFGEVGEYWEAHDIFVSVFGKHNMYLENEFDKHGLDLIYGSGSVDSDGDAFLKKIIYFEKNFKYTRKSEEMVNQEGQNFDMRTAYSPDGSFISMPFTYGGESFTGEFRPIRYKTGKELCKGNAEPANYDKRKRLTNCTDVYVYNRDIAHLDMNNLRNIEPQKTGRYLRSHYRLGDVYQDEEGSRWFVVGNAGNISDYSDYSELVCFENIKTTSDGSEALELPTRDQAIRATVFLWQLFNEGIVKKSLEALNASSGMPRCVYNIIKGADVDPRFLFIAKRAQNPAARSDTHLASVAYSSEYGDDTQHLLRFICDNQDEDKEPRFHFWEHYPNNPSADVLFPASFSKNYITLQDIAQDYMVRIHAEDHFVHRPLSSVTGGDNTTPEAARNRSDEAAIDVRNYFYNQSAWFQYKNHLSMWNEPVLVFRYAAIYDRGEKDYQTKTIDGKHTMKLLKARVWSLDKEEGDDDVKDVMDCRKVMFKSVRGGRTLLDEKEIDWPEWYKTIK